MASTSSSSQEIVPSPSTSAIRSVGLRSLFSSCCNCWEWIAPSPSATYASEQAAPSPSDIHAFEGIAPSSSTMPERKVPYDVFINHRGLDVKKTLAATLYHTLTVMGLRVFLDKEELKSGDFLPREIEEAMGSASLHIAIFSQNYAQSPWCLAELSFMLKTGTRIVPVFYHVEPADVRHVKGAYAEAFSRHTQKGRYTEKIEEWKNALNIVSYYVGHIVHSEDDEWRLPKNIVNCILKAIKNVPFVVAEHPVGLDEAVKGFERTTLQYAESHRPVQVVGIWGMGGSGKTTLAKELYNNKYTDMDKASLLLDVRDATCRGKLHNKQQELLKDLGLEDQSVDHIEKGKGILVNRLRYIKVLIILDDVDSVDQLNALVPNKDSLGEGSLIVVTTRNLEVLQGWKISSIYKMEALHEPHAKELFCWHAFLSRCPLEGFDELVEKFIGGLLYGKTNKDYWGSLLERICRILPSDIMDRLKVSYDALDDDQKEAFLDVACFFIGHEKTSAIAVWDGSPGSGLCCWENLFNKCLVELTNNDKIRMHDHLRDLGRKIANDRSPYRLWSPQQTINIGDGVQGIAIRGIMLTSVESTSKNEEFLQCSQDGKFVVKTDKGRISLEPSSLGLKILHVDGNYYNHVIGDLSRELVWLSWHNFKQRNLQSLSSLKNLRVLEVHERWAQTKRNAIQLEEIWETEINAPVQLRELVINDCPKFQGFPKSIGCLRHLKKIIIKRWNKVESLPEEFGLLESLEHLDLTDNELSSLPTSFGDLRNLRHLELSNCEKLKRLPISFKELTLLQHLSLYRCLELTLESDIMENMTKLEYLYMDCCIEEMPRHITNQASLTELSCCLKRLRELPPSIGQLSKLRSLSIQGSELLTSLPISLGQLSNLQKLCIENCAISELDLGAGSLTCLKVIDLFSTEVSKISISEDCCPSLKTLLLEDNRNLTNISFDALTSFAQSDFLQEFELKGCYGVKKIQGLEHCRALEILRVHTWWEEAGIESLERMQRLRKVELQAISRSSLEGCIESMQKWPKEEIMVCTRAVPDAATLLNSFDFSELRVVDSFANQEIKSRPSLKCPSTTDGCILFCFVVNCESRTWCWKWFGPRSGHEIFLLEKGKWVFTGLLTQQSHILELSIGIEEVEGEGEVEKGVVVMGEEERVWEAFKGLWATLSN